MSSSIRSILSNFGSITEQAAHMVHAENLGTIKKRKREKQV